MKLKRFLLRYEPPGIGLEVEDDSGQKSVHHKDLPAENIKTPKDIRGLVDQLIEEETYLLSKRRHGKALFELLGRLYMVEVEATDEDEANSPVKEVSARTAPPEANSPVEAGVEEGQRVVLIGLKGKQQTSNGEVVTVTKAKDGRKFEVSFTNHEVLKVKGVEHLVPVAPHGTSLAVGTHVAIRGLRNHVELNGCLGRVVECHEESHRFEVRATDSGQLFRVKQENLIPIEAIPAVVGAAKENREPNTSSTPRLKKDSSGGGAATLPGAAGIESNAALAAGASGGEGDGEVFELGSTVQLHGLKTAQNYNGQQAEVLSVDRARCRYEIRLHDGSVKTIRAENVRLVAGPSKTSPRTRRGGPRS